MAVKIIIKYVTSQKIMITSQKLSYLSSLFSALNQPVFVLSASASQTSRKLTSQNGQSYVILYLILLLNIHDVILWQFDLLSKVNDYVTRRKIRLIEGNANGRHLKNTCKGTLRPVFICVRPRTPYPPPSYTLYTSIKHTYSHTKGGDGGELNQREG
jgi:hypothetical protein